MGTITRNMNFNDWKHEVEVALRVIRQEKIEKSCNFNIIARACNNGFEVFLSVDENAEKVHIANCESKYLFGKYSCNLIEALSNNGYLLKKIEHNGEQHQFNFKKL